MNKKLFWDWVWELAPFVIWDICKYINQRDIILISDNIGIDRYKLGEKLSEKDLVIIDNLMIFSRYAIFAILVIEKRDLIKMAFIDLLKKYCQINIWVFHIMNSHGIPNRDTRIDLVEYR
jgi:hypothetical protein